MPTGRLTWTDAGWPAGASVRVDAVGRNAPSPAATGTQTPLRHSGAYRSVRTWACCQGCTGRTTWSGPATPAPAMAACSAARRRLLVGKRSEARPAGLGPGPGATTGPGQHEDVRQAVGGAASEVVAPHGDPVEPEGPLAGRRVPPVPRLVPPDPGPAGGME